MRTFLNMNMPVARLMLAGLCAVGLLGVQGCATMEMPKPKYPVYMQDKPEAAAPTPAPMAEAPTPEAAPAPVISAPPSSGTITATDLPPPPPPPTAAEIAAPAPQTAPQAVAAAPAPAPTTVPAAAKSGAVYAYTLQAHDTLYGVSRRFGVPVQTLYALNGLSAASTFKIGQRILLPGSAVDKGAEDHANGGTMTKLPSAIVADATPSARPVTPPPTPKPAAPAPVPATPSKPTVAPPAQTTSVAVAAPPKPVVTPPATTTTTTSSATSAPPPAAPTPKPVPQPVSPPVAGFPTSTQLSQMGRGMFAWPVKGKILVPFGQLAPNVRNDGLNIQASAGTNVVAASDGVVVYEGDQVKELGNTVYIKHANGWYTGYSHLQSMSVKNNERVTKGQVIGTVGATGVIDQPQLHFEIRYTPSSDIARPIDPNLVLP